MRADPQRRASAVQLRCIEMLEQRLGRKAKMELLPLQPGDVPDTEADMSELHRATGRWCRWRLGGSWRGTGGITRILADSPGTCRRESVALYSMQVHI
jgi:hypothetical protein